jgi:hypothetical protein
MQNAAQENWSILLSLFPPKWNQRARESGAVERLRGFSSPEALLRTLLLHVANGLSLRETAVQAKLAGWAAVSDVALLKRLRNSEEWLRLLCGDLLRENGVALATAATNRRIRIVDGTIVREPGKTGSQWRILYSLRLPSLDCDFFEISGTAGVGTGESLQRVPLAAHDFILGDAGYWSTAEVESAQGRGADVLIRVNPQNFVGSGPDNRPFRLLPHLRTLPQAGDIGEWRVTLPGQHMAVAGRVCAIRKSQHATEQARRRLHRKASKRQTRLQPQTLEYACYVIVFTTEMSGSAEEILELYRLRWQIELVFKRMKAIAQLGHLPKHDERSARAWLYGKMLVALLTQKLIRIGRDISPWGYRLRSAAAAQPLA